MNNVNKTLYIPLYGKALVSAKNIILKDKKAEKIWSKEGFALKGKSKSKWLAYYMAMRAAVYDEWLEGELKANPEMVVLHIGCGLDGRIERVSVENHPWYDIDFPEVISERRKYYEESSNYHMLGADMRTGVWKSQLVKGQDAVIVLEGVSMYFQPKELAAMLKSFSEHFRSVKILMDCYTVKAAKVSKYKNPINDVGVTEVYGYDEPEQLSEQAGLQFVKEHSMTPEKYIRELQGMEATIFRKLYAGRLARALYRMYEFEK